MSEDQVNCSLWGICGGCNWGGKPLREQHQEKMASVSTLTQKVNFAYAPIGRVRDRADLVWENVGGEMRLGLYKIGSRETVAIDRCPLMSPQLDAFYQEFKKLVPPIGKGSVRLRVSPDKEWGVWLDFANEDVKTLFEQKQYLRDLSEIAFVGIGQRRKSLIWKEGQPKLDDPVLKPWFETYDASFDPIPLYGPVGGFTQAGFEANKALVKAVMETVAQTRHHSWTELFCGSGNFTVALAARGYDVEAVEMDELALDGLKQSLSSHAEWTEKVFVQRADVYLKAQSLPKLEGKGLLVDPPRAGLREVLSLMTSGNQPRFLVYVSCFTESFLADAQSLANRGYQLKSLVAVDQFPHSSHTEWVALFAL